MSQPQPAQQPVPDTAALREAVACALRHAEAGDLPGVVAVLNGPLSRLDASSLTVDVMDAAAVFAHALAGTEQLGPALQWATWAYRAGQTYPGAEPRAVRPVQVHAAVLAATGNTSQAVAVYRDLVDLLTALDGPTAMRTLCARADLAVALHRGGACPTAHATLDEVWTLCRTRHGPRHPTAIRMCTRLAMMYRDCGDPDQAGRLFTQARHDAAASPAGGPVADATGRPADPAHVRVCTHTPGTGLIHWPHTETTDPW